MIEVKNLSISFKEKTVFRNINITIHESETTVIFGKNGSGKSVLLKAIAGLIKNYKGSIKINEDDISDFHEKKESSMAYVFQKGGLFDSMNIYDNIAFPLRRRKVHEVEIKEIINNILRQLELTGSEYKLPSELSGGMQKRVGLARAICINPKYILYDDPTAGLDPILSDAIADIMIKIKENYKTTSMVVTHDLKVARKIADSIILLYSGSVVFCGSNNEFFNGENPFSRQFIQGDLTGPIDVF